MHESRKDYEEHKADWTQEKKVELRRENHDCEMFQGITEPREVQYNDKNNDRESDFGHLICACN